MPIRHAVLWVRDTSFDLWQLLHPLKERSFTELPSWKPPADGWLKCNFDGAFYSDGRGATGAVLHDHNGRFRGGSAKWYDHCLDALSMEALALRDSVILATKFGATRVYFETDCQNLLHLWTLRNEQKIVYRCNPQGDS